MQAFIKLFSRLWSIDKDVTQTNENKTKEQSFGFISMLLGALVTSLLGSLLSDKEVIRAGDGVSRSGDGIKERKYF